MADKKISQLTALTGANTAADDLLAIVDTNAAETKKITREEFFKNIQGNVGVGVTPSAWGSGTSAIDVGTGSAFYNPGSVTQTHILTNSYNNGTNFIYKGTGSASRYRMIGAQHEFYTAPSGTAGNAITFTQAMTLDAFGNLLIGTTSTLGTSPRLNVLFDGEFIWGQTNESTRAYGNHFAIRNTNGLVGSIQSVGTTTAYNTSSDYRLKNITGPVTNSGAYIDSLKPVEGTWKADGSTFVGLIAHEVQESSRTNVATGVKDGEEMQGMDYSSAEIIANLIAEIQSLRGRVALLESK